MKAKRLQAIRGALVLLGVFPSLLLADNTARLTISGYMPPMQRVTTVQPTTSVETDGGVLLQVQSNSATAYTVSVEPQASEANGDGASGFVLKQDGQVLSPNGSGTLPAVTLGLPGSGAPTLLEILPTPNQTGGAVVLTIASQ